jgi:uncharacterized protein (TIGR02453 family)
MEFFVTVQRENNFTGFKKEAISFLRELKKNNNKAWFHAHKDEYVEYLLDPLKDLVADLSGYMLTIDPVFNVTPAVNKTISPPTRDTRYSRDKSPYKTKMWISFMRSKKGWQTHPTYYFKICIDSYEYGMGFYNASAATMRIFREMIDTNPNDFLKAVSFFKKQDTFALEGEKYKRIIDASKPDDIQEWYQRKNFYLVCNKKVVDALFSARLVDDIISGFKMTVPLYNYLWRVIARQMAEREPALNSHEERWPHRGY